MIKKIVKVDFAYFTFKKNENTTNHSLSSPIIEIYELFQAPIKELEDEKKDHVTRLLQMEKEMEDVFDRKVHEKEKKLAATEEDLKKKLYESQENLDKQKIDLEAKMATFEKVNDICFLNHYFFQCPIIE